MARYIMQYDSNINYKPKFKSTILDYMSIPITTIQQNAKYLRLIGNDWVSQLHFWNIFKFV